MLNLELKYTFNFSSRTLSESLASWLLLFWQNSLSFHHEIIWSLRVVKLGFCEQSHMVLSSLYPNLGLKKIDFSMLI